MRIVLFVGVLMLGVGCTEYEVDSSACVARCFKKSLSMLSDIDHETPNTIDLANACAQIHGGQRCCVKQDVVQYHCTRHVYGKTTP